MDKENKTFVNAGSWDSLDFCESEHVKKYIESLEEKINEGCAKVQKAYQFFKKEPFNTLRFEKLNEATIGLRSIYKHAELWLDEFGRYTDADWKALQEEHLKDHYKHYGSCRDEGFKGKEFIKN